MSTQNSSQPEFANNHFGIGEICDAVGFPKEELTRSVMTQCVIPCIITAFCDEMPIQHPPLAQPLSEHFGEWSFTSGTFHHRVRAIPDDESPLKTTLNQFVEFCADTLAQQVIAGVRQLAVGKIISIHRKKRLIEFDNTSALLARDVKRVIDYGPGLHGRFFIQQQMEDILNKTAPYQYLALDKGPFVNSFLQSYWRRQTGHSSAFRAILDKQIFVGSEQGIASATHEIIELEQKASSASEVADLIIASNVSKVEKEDLAIGMAHAYRLLRDHGSLLIRGPKEVEAEHETSAGEMLEFAFNGGFTPQKTHIYKINKGTRKAPITWLSIVLRK